MQFHKLLCRYESMGGEVGDCFRTAFACLLDREPASVPHFVAENPHMHNVDKKARKWFQAEGYDYFVIPFNASLDDLLSSQEVLNPNLYYILGGNNPEGHGHCIICCGGKFIWDPSPRNLFITAPMDDGMYWLHFLTSSQFTARVNKLEHKS